MSDRSNVMNMQSTENDVYLNLGSMTIGNNSNILQDMSVFVIRDMGETIATFSRQAIQLNRPIKTEGDIQFDDSIKTTGIVTSNIVIYNDTDTGATVLQVSSNLESIAYLSTSNQGQFYVGGGIGVGASPNSNYGLIVSGNTQLQKVYGESFQYSPELPYGMVITNSNILIDAPTVVVNNLQISGLNEFDTMTVNNLSTFRGRLLACNVDLTNKDGSTNPLKITQKLIGGSFPSTINGNPISVYAEYPDVGLVNTFQLSSKGHITMGLNPDYTREYMIRGAIQANRYDYFQGFLHFTNSNTNKQSFTVNRDGYLSIGNQNSTSMLEVKNNFTGGELYYTPPTTLLRLENANATNQIPYLKCVLPTGQSKFNITNTGTVAFSDSVIDNTKYDIESPNNAYFHALEVGQITGIGGSCNTAQFQYGRFDNLEGGHITLNSGVLSNVLIHTLLVEDITTLSLECIDGLNDPKELKVLSERFLINSSNIVINRDRYFYTSNDNSNLTTDSVRIYTTGKTTDEVNAVHTIGENSEIRHRIYNTSIGIDTKASHDLVANQNMFKIGVANKNATPNTNATFYITPITTNGDTGGIDNNTSAMSVFRDKSVKFGTATFIDPSGKITVGTSTAQTTHNLYVKGGMAVKTADVEAPALLINDVGGNVAIGTSTPAQVKLVISSTDAVQLPKGTSTQRPTGVLGYIRYNTETSQFEGFGAGNNWGSLGGVKSVSGDTYITAEYTPGNDDKSLHFYTYNAERMTLDQHGNLGIGTTTPLARADINGDLRVSGTIRDSNGQNVWFPGSSMNWVSAGSPTINVPSGITFSYLRQSGSYRYVGKDMQYVFEIVGTVSGTANELTSNYTFNLNNPVSSTIYTSSTTVGSAFITSYSPTDSNIYFGYLRTDPMDTSKLSIRYVNGTTDCSLTDIRPTTTLTIQGQISYTTELPSTVLPPATLTMFSTDASNNTIYNGSGQAPQATFEVRSTTSNSAFVINQTISTYDILQLKASGTTRSVFDKNGNLGIGTTSPLAPLHVVGTTIHTGHIIPTSCNVYDLGTSNLRWKDLYLSGNTIDLGGTIITRNSTTGGINVSSAVSTQTFVPMSVGNIGIGTTTPLQPLHVVGQSYFTTNVGIGTTTGRQLLDVQGGDTILSGNLGIGTITPVLPLHVVGRSYFTGNVGIGTTNGRQLLDVQGGNAIISGRIGIATSSPLQPLHVVGQSYFTTNVGIGTTTGRQLLDVQGGNAILSGNLGIGTIAPALPLHVVGRSYFTGNVGIGTTFATQGLHVVGSMYATGDITAFSDAIMKDNLTPIPNALEKVSKITGYTFTRKDDPNHKTYAGVLAQEIKEVLPEVVYTNGDTMSVAYGNISALLIQAIKELREENERLKERMSHYENF